MQQGEQIEFAVRRDDLKLRRVQDSAPEPDQCRIACKISATEYQGYFVKVMLEVVDQKEIIAYVPEREFFDTSLVEGDQVFATWHAHRSRILT